MLLIGDDIVMSYLQRASEDLCQQCDIGQLSLREFGYLVYIGFAFALVLIFSVA